MKNSPQSPHLEVKALYNTFSMLASEEEKKKEPSWKSRRWRTMAMEELFSELRSLKIGLDTKQLYHWAADCDTPEDLLELLVGEEEERNEQSDHIYLILFELWRRLIPEKRSLSIVGDDMDSCIDLFDRGEEISDVEVEELLSEWRRFLDSLIDQGYTKGEALFQVEAFFAHDVPDFSIDFLLEVTDRQDTHFASLLLEKVRDYCFQEPLWIQFIELKIALREEDIDAVRHKLGELVSAVLTADGCIVELTLALCDIAVELRKKELLSRLLDKLSSHIQDEDDRLAFQGFQRRLREL